MPELDGGRKRMGNRVLTEWGVEGNLDAAGEIFSCPLLALGAGKTGTCARPNHTRNQGAFGRWRDRVGKNLRPCNWSRWDKYMGRG
jgi:hypothetical protein